MNTVAQNSIALNLILTLLCGFPVMFMQAGFAMAGTGFNRAKNASHTMAMNIMAFCLAMLGYWGTGFAIQTGNYKALFLSGTHGGGFFVVFFFQMALMSIAAVIPAGAMAERWSFKSFAIYAVLMGAFIYPVFGNWAWGGGWLSRLGADFGLGHGLVDFAGSSVIHMTGGVTALAGAWILGPRMGKFGKNGAPNAIPGHHIPMAVTGTLILAFGWLGITSGSALVVGDPHIGQAAVNTVLAGGAGAAAAMLYMWLRFGRPDLSLILNGLLAGLVAISAPCAFVGLPAAVFIGAAAGVFVCWGVFFTERVLKVDDPVGAFAVHGLGGAWGMIALGLFADGSFGFGLNGGAGPVKGLFYGAPDQLWAQCIGVAANFAYAGAASAAVFKAIDFIAGNRVPPEVEDEGLDAAEVTVAAYPDFNLRKTSR
ncbi:MAG: ammonium transporter [Nitrospirota bacterium]